MKPSTCVLVSSIGLCWLNTASGIERSHVFCLHAPADAADLGVLQEFRVDTIGWGSAGDPNISAIRDMGIKYNMVLSLSIWGGAAVQDRNSPTGQQACFNFNGFRVQALGSGFPSARMYRLCPHKPGWNFDWLSSHAAKGMDGFQMDCPIGSSGQYFAHLMQGACYCDACLKAFRVYLAETYTPQELAALGVPDVSTYNHRETVSKICATVGEFAEQLKDGQIPLGKDYLLFQMIAGTKLGRKTDDVIRQSASGPAVVTANAWYMAPYNLYTTEFADYFLAETHYHAGNWNTKTTPYSLARVVKVADAVGKRVVCAPSIGDMKMLKKSGYNNPNEMALWAAGTYALGAIHTAPVSYQWAGKPDFKSAPDAYAPIYRWIKDNAFLFDGYEPWDEGIALVYNNWASLKTFGKVELGSKTYRNGYDNASARMVNANLQFKVVVAGDPYFYKRLAAESDFAPYSTVVLPTDAFLCGTQREVFDDLVAAGTATVAKNRFQVDKLFSGYDAAVTVDDPDVWAIVRRNPKTKSLAVHLLNREHDHATDKVSSQQNFHVSIREDVLGGGLTDRVVLHAPGEAPIDLHYETIGGRIVIDMPQLYLWNIIILSVTDRGSKK